MNTSANNNHQDATLFDNRPYGEQQASQVPPAIPAQQEQPEPEAANFTDEEPGNHMTQTNTTEEYAENTEISSNKKQNTWVLPAAAGAGLVLGAGGMLVVKALTPSAHAAEPGKELNLAELMTDGEVAIARNVTDDMTFAEAFAAARSEEGPGSIFVWRGNVYSTYTEAEWTAMTSEEQTAYAEHFNWDGADQIYQDNNTDIEEVPVDQPFKIVEIGHDDETGADYAVMDLADHDAVLIDADADGSMDYMAIDANEDGQITPEEVMDLHQAGIEIATDDLAAAMDVDTPLDA